ncbi:MAG: parallel beta-helix domain-containing protein, partial [Nevskiales bacterium]
LDSPGDAFKLQGVDHGTLRRVRAFWSSGRKTASEDTVTAENYKEKLHVECTDPARHNPANPNPTETDNTSPDYNVSIQSGRYGIYPVEFTESVGASDAGIYVGQTDNAIIRNSRAAFNVFGFEIENVRGGEYADNLAECNTGGFLVYDLDGLTRYGSKTRMYRNKAINNNTYNFAEPGSIVSNVPRGVGMITLGYDRIDIFDNVFEDNGTAGIVHTSYELFGEPGDRRLDMYSEGLHIYNNVFRNNGNDIPQPDYATIIATGGDQVTSVFPMLVGLKNAAGGANYRGAHIIWDGYLDELDEDCDYPVDGEGQDIPADENGKPIQGNQYPNPSCRYNKYKFDNQGERIKPLWWASCIDENNEFDADSLAYANFHGTEGLEAVVGLNPTDPTNLIDLVVDTLSSLPDFPSSTDITPHRCEQQYGSNLSPLPPIVIPPFQRSGEVDPAPSPELVAQLCNAGAAAGQVNEAAYQVNCPLLSQYNLFSNPADPTSMPNGRGVPFVLNSKLFSDYSTKYRVAYIPTGQQATYRDGDDGVNATILFPVGTIIAKSFAFADETTGQEPVAETRLLIKRMNSSGIPYWDGVEYIWVVENGQRVAKLAQGGGVAQVSWNYDDVNTGENYQGQSDDYLLPNANQCKSCHSNDDLETGSAPIGPKPRNLNRPFASESPIMHGVDSHPVNGVNQLVYWCQNGLMRNCPAPMQVDATSQYVTNVERNPIFNIAGDSGFAAGSDEDIEARVRSYLEVNCAHCHNSRGLAQNTGFYLDVFRDVNDTYGICKGPTASGTEGRGGREFDIVPGNAAASILPYRLGPEATSLAARMPPLARSVVHQGAF